MHTNTAGTKERFFFFLLLLMFNYDFCRCMVEAGYDYSTDCLPDPAVWEQMLNKSPIKHITQVWVFLHISLDCAHATSLVLSHHVVT